MSTHTLRTALTLVSLLTLTACSSARVAPQSPASARAVASREAAPRGAAPVQALASVWDEASAPATCADPTLCLSVCAPGDARCRRACEVVAWEHNAALLTSLEACELACRGDEECTRARCHGEVAVCAGSFAVADLLAPPGRAYADAPKPRTWALLDAR